MTTTDMMIEHDVEFNDSAEAHAFIEEMLSNHAYSHPEIAALREYVNNGLDAQKDLYAPGEAPPIEVDLPHEDNAYTLTITDHGHGMSLEETIRNHGGFYHSTKRGDVTTAGDMGVGSKVGYAVAPMFTVTTTKDGMRSIVAYRTKAAGGKGRTVLFHGPSDEPNGTTVSVPVNNKKNTQWRNAAHELFTWYSPDDVHIITHENTYVNEPGWALKQIDWLSEDIGLIPRKIKSDTILMGGVPYPLPFEQLKQIINPDLLRREYYRMADEKGVDKSLVLVVPNKSLVAQTSRESLTFNEEAKALLSSYSNRLLDLLHDYNQARIDVWTPQKGEHISLVGHYMKHTKPYLYKGESIETAPGAKFYSFRQHNRHGRTANVTSEDKHKMYGPAHTEWVYQNPRMLVTYAADYTETQVRSAIRHYIKENNILDNLDEYTTINATVRPFDAEAWEKVIPAYWTLNAHDIVKVYNDDMKMRRELRAEKAKFEKIAVLKQRGIDPEKVNLSTVSTKMFETRCTFDGISEMMNLDEIIEAYKSKKKPLIYIVSESMTNLLDINIITWGKDEKRLIVFAKNPKNIATKLRKEKVKCFCSSEWSYEARDEMHALEYKHSESIVRSMLTLEEASPSVHITGYLYDMAHAVNQSEIEVKNPTIRKFFKVLSEKYNVIPEYRNWSHYINRGRDYEDGRFVNWVLQHHIMLRVPSSAIHTKEAADDLITYINAKKVKP